jgi:hypothetical protein
MIRILYILIIASLTACTSPGAGDCPVDIDVLAPVMTDLHLAKALSPEVPIQFRDSMEEVYYDKIFEDHQIDRTSFDSMMWVVRQEPAWIDSLYTRVGESLARIEAEIQ